MSRTIIFWLACVCLLSSGNALFAQKLVNLYVTVQNERAQLIKGMKAENFRVFEDNKPKEIKLFSSESEPASVAFIFDLSHSVTHNETDDSKSRMRWFRKSAVDFLQLSRADNEYTLISFGETALELADGVNRDKATAVINNDSEFVRPKKDNSTPLFNTIKFAIEKLQKSKNERRILIVMSDGLDNASTQNAKNDVDLMIRSSLIPIYMLLAYDPSARDQNLAATGRPRIASVADDSGGKSFGAMSETDARNVMMRVATMIENQYRLGFAPEPITTEGKARKLEVKLEISKTDKESIQWPSILYCKKYLPSPVKSN